MYEVCQSIGAISNDNPFYREVVSKHRKLSCAVKAISRWDRVLSDGSRRPRCWLSADGYGSPLSAEEREEAERICCEIEWDKYDRRRRFTSI